MTEQELQQSIVDVLRVSGCHVYETSTYWQRGPSGVDRGIPDLLVSHPHIPEAFLGIEVKGLRTQLSAEQDEAVALRRYRVARSVPAAIEIALDWLDRHYHPARFLPFLSYAHPGQRDVAVEAIWRTMGRLTTVRMQLITEAERLRLGELSKQLEVRHCSQVLAPSKQAWLLEHGLQAEIDLIPRGGE